MDRAELVDNRYTLQNLAERLSYHIIGNSECLTIAQTLVGKWIFSKRSSG